MSSEHNTDIITTITVDAGLFLRSSVALWSMPQPALNQQWRNLLLL
jgi:hypothetical protein